MDPIEGELLILHESSDGKRLGCVIEEKRLQDEGEPGNGHVNLGVDLNQAIGRHQLESCLGDGGAVDHGFGRSRA